MPDDATEGVAEHSSRLQPSINLHAPVTAFMFSCSGTQCTTPEGMKARVSPQPPPLDAYSLSTRITRFSSYMF